MLYLYHLLIDNPDDCIKFDKIVYEYEGMIKRVAFSVTKDSFYADEAAQSALISIARNISHIKTDNVNMLKSYIYTVAENAGIDAWRRKMRDQRVSNIDDYVDIPSDDNLFDSIFGTEYTKKLIKLLDKIPVHYREVLVLSILHEHSLYQIADELNRKYCTVRQQLVRGKKMLAELMKEAEGND